MPDLITPALFSPPIRREKRENSLPFPRFFAVSFPFSPGGKGGGWERRG
jgi:hypothetical protein